jgi:hypothetical protein
MNVNSHIGVDRQLTNDLRVRLTGSMYKTNKAMSDTLYSGDRAGSRFYYVLAMRWGPAGYRMASAATYSAHVPADAAVRTWFQKVQSRR